MTKRRQFGWIRQLQSGRFQASYISPTGARQYAPDTFRTKSDANRWLALVEADLSRGTWLDDRAGLETLGNYARSILRDSPKIGVRWRETCERNMRIHLVPLLDVPLRALTASRVREWHAAALRGSGGRTSISQTYRFLRMVMNTAVREGIIARNPCQVPGAGTVRARERPVATPAEVVALVDAINPRYRTAVLIAAWCGLRRGEIAGLRISDVDLGTHTITVRSKRWPASMPVTASYFQRHASMGLCPWLSPGAPGSPNVVARGLHAEITSQRAPLKPSRPPSTHPPGSGPAPGLPHPDEP